MYHSIMNRHEGAKRHPPSWYSFDKSSDYHRTLRNDLDRMFKDEVLQTAGSPKWASSVSSERNHSGQSPLYIHRLLSPSSTRGMNQGSPKPSLETYPRAFNRAKNSKPPPRKGMLYCRKTSAHTFLHATPGMNTYSHGNTDAIDTERQTRTTLLRARQRCNSAPVNSYAARREMIKREQEVIDLRNTYASQVNISFRDLLSIPSMSNGESMHGFLIGARYNRAHHLDANSLRNYGVYMPRGNPQGCFVLRPSSARVHSDPTAGFVDRDSPSINSSNSALSSSASSLCSSDDGNDMTPHPSTPQPYTPCSTPGPEPVGTAWPPDGYNDGPPPPPRGVGASVNEAQVQFPEVSEMGMTDPVDIQTGRPRHPINLIEEVLNFDDDLNIQGRGLSGAGSIRPKSAPPFSSTGPRSITPVDLKPTALQSSTEMLASVTIHGMPIRRKTDTIEETAMANEPAIIIPSTSASNVTTASMRQPGNVSSVERASASTEADLQSLLGSHKLEVKDAKLKSNSVIKVDKSVSTCEEDFELVSEQTTVKSCVRDLNTDITAKSKHTKVRFADEIQNVHPQGTQTNDGEIKFFLTEEETLAKKQEHDGIIDGRDGQPPTKSDAEIEPVVDRESIITVDITAKAQ